MLTIAAPLYDHTFYFDHPIPQPNYIRLLSCSLYNSWYNLKSGKITLTDKEERNKKYDASLLPGFYTIESFAKTFKNAFLKRKIEIISDVYTHTGALYLKNPDPSRYDINISEELAELFDIGQILPWIRYVIKLQSPSSYFMNCDLINKETNFYNGSPSSILAHFDIKGRPFEKVFYKEQKQVLRDTSTDVYVNCLNISVKDENGNLFYFNSMPLTLVLEIN